MENKKNERLELRSEVKSLESRLSEITRKKPTIKKIESSVLSRVKAFIPEMKKGEVDLWMKMKVDVRIYYN